MASATPEGFTPAASPSAAPTPNPEALRASARFSVAPTPSYYGFNCRPRQVRHYACERDAEQVAQALRDGRTLYGTTVPTREVAAAYLWRLNAALAKAEATFAAVEADEERTRAAYFAASGVAREALHRDLKRIQGARWARADERRDIIREARDTVAAALSATQEGGAQ